jgi:hypothetical protein
MKIRQLAAIAAAGIALSGCASIIKGTTQSILITTPPTTGAYCVLTSKEGSWTVTTPGPVKVDKTKDDILIRCTKAGFQDATASIPSDFEGWTLGNLILGGVIGVGVDAATGAMNEYPHAFAVPMTPGTSSTTAPMPTLPAQPVTPGAPPGTSS